MTNVSCKGETYLFRNLVKYTYSEWQQNKVQFLPQITSI